MTPNNYHIARERMVREQLIANGISDPRVLDVMLKVPRHLFLDSDLGPQAYSDHSFPIGFSQTMSQPFMVAYLCEQLLLTGNEKILEIGTGSGYQAAVLSHLVSRVSTIEIKPRLWRQSTATLTQAGYANVQTRAGDGYFGWPERAPFDAIMITAAVDHIPPPLLKQLREGGRLILPLGNPFGFQNLVLVTRKGEDFTVRQITGVLFVPLTGYALEHGAKAP